MSQPNNAFSALIEAQLRSHSPVSSNLPQSRTGFIATQPQTILSGLNSAHIRNRFHAPSPIGQSFDRLFSQSSIAQHQVRFPPPNLLAQSQDPYYPPSSMAQLHAALYSQNPQVLFDPQNVLSPYYQEALTQQMLMDSKILPRYPYPFNAHDLNSHYASIAYLNSLHSLHMNQQPSSLSQALGVNNSSFPSISTNRFSNSSLPSVQPYSHVINDRRANQPSSSSSSVQAYSQITDDRRAKQTSSSASVQAYSQITDDRRENQHTSNSFTPVQPNFQVEDRANQPSVSFTSVQSNSQAVDIGRANQPSRSLASVQQDYQVLDGIRTNQFSNFVSEQPDSKVKDGMKVKKPSNLASVQSELQGIDGRTENLPATSSLTLQQSHPKINRRKTVPVKRKLKENKAVIKKPARKRRKKSELEEMESPSDNRASPKLDIVPASAISSGTSIWSDFLKFKASQDTQSTKQPALPTSPRPNIPSNVGYSPFAHNLNNQFNRDLRSPYGLPSYQSTPVSHHCGQSSDGTTNLSSIQQSGSIYGMAKSLQIGDNKKKSNKDQNVLAIKSYSSASFLGSLNDNKTLEQSKDDNLGYRHKILEQSKDDNLGYRHTILEQSKDDNLEYGNMNLDQSKRMFTGNMPIGSASLHHPNPYVGVPNVLSQSLNASDDKVGTWIKPDTDPSDIVYDNTYKDALDLSSTDSLSRSSVLQESQSTPQAKEDCKDVKPLDSDSLVAPSLEPAAELCLHSVKKLTDNPMTNNVVDYKYQNGMTTETGSKHVSPSHEVKLEIQQIKEVLEETITSEIAPESKASKEDSEQHINGIHQAVSLLDQTVKKIKTDGVASSEKRDHCKEEVDTYLGITASGDSHKSPTQSSQNRSFDVPSLQRQSDMNQSVNFIDSCLGDIQALNQSTGFTVSENSHNNRTNSLLNGTSYSPPPDKHPDLNQHSSSSKNSNPCTNYSHPYYTNNVQYYKGDKLDHNSLTSSSDSFYNSQKLYIDLQYDDTQYDSPEEIEVYPRLINVDKKKVCDTSMSDNTKNVPENNSEPSLVQTSSLVSNDKDVISVNLSPSYNANNNVGENSTEKVSQLYAGQTEPQDIQNSNSYSMIENYTSSVSDKTISESNTSGFDSKWEIIYGSDPNINLNHTMTESKLSPSSYCTKSSFAQVEEDISSSNNSQSGFQDTTHRDNNQSSSYNATERSQGTDDFDSKWEIIYNSESAVNQNSAAVQANHEIDNQLTNHSAKHSDMPTEDIRDHEHLDTGEKRSVSPRCTSQCGSREITYHKTCISTQVEDPSFTFGEQGVEVTDPSNVNILQRGESSAQKVVESNDHYFNAAMSTKNKNRSVSEKITSAIQIKEEISEMDIELSRSNKLDNTNTGKADLIKDIDPVNGDIDPYEEIDPLNRDNDPMNRNIDLIEIKEEKKSQSSEQNIPQCKTNFKGVMKRTTKCGRKQESKKDVDTPKKQTKMSGFFKNSVNAFPTIYEDKDTPPILKIEIDQSHENLVGDYSLSPPILENERDKVHENLMGDNSLSKPILENENLWPNKILSDTKITKNKTSALVSKEIAKPIKLEKTILFKKENNCKGSKLKPKTDCKRFVSSQGSDKSYLSRGKQMLLRSQEQSVTKQYESCNKLTSNRMHAGTFKSPAVSLKKKRSLCANERPKGMVIAINLREIPWSKICSVLIVSEIKHLWPIDMHISFKAQSKSSYLVIKVEDLSKLYKPVASQMMLTALKATTSNQEAPSQHTSVSSASVRITAGETARGLYNGSEKASGVIPVVTMSMCETCGCQYSCTMTMHVNSDRHQMCINKPGFYAGLDELIFSIDSVDQMVQKLKRLEASNHEDDPSSSSTNISNNQENILLFNRQSNYKNIDSIDVLPGTQAYQCSPTPNNTMEPVQKSVLQPITQPGVQISEANVGHQLFDNTLLTQTPRLNFNFLTTYRKSKNPENISESSSSKQRKKSKERKKSKTKPCTEATEEENLNYASIFGMFENMNITTGCPDELLNVPSESVVKDKAEYVTGVGSPRMGNVKSFKVKKLKKVPDILIVPTSTVDSKMSNEVGKNLFLQCMKELKTETSMEQNSSNSK